MTSDTQPTTLEEAHRHIGTCDRRGASECLRCRLAYEVIRLSAALGDYECPHCGSEWAGEARYNVGARNAHISLCQPRAPGAA